MQKIELTNTKQSKQITNVRNRIEKQGWTIINEVAREFNGKPTWNINDDIPNLIYSWSIQRNTIYQPIWIDFIAWYDYITYETHVKNCSHCMIRDTKIQLDFNKDKSLQNYTKKEAWKAKVTRFMNELNKIEKEKEKEKEI